MGQSGMSLHGFPDLKVGAIDIMEGYERALKLRRKGTAFRGTS